MLSSPRKHSPSLGFLFGLPLEVIQSIIFSLVAQRPLGTPSALVPLFTTSRALHAIATSPALLARVFRFKFDTGAVERRLFQPTHADLKEQLVHACTLLRELRSGNVFVEDAGTHLFSALVLLFENDGKNYAQLEWAGLSQYAEEFVQHRLWENASETNEGWPLDNDDNASALWILWLTLTKDKLQKESIRDRESFILYVLPFILHTFRYAAAQAPPNHFDLPLPADNTSDRFSFPIPSSSQTPPRYPIYPSASAPISQPHFGARIPLRVPLASLPAKLLYVSRRETRKISIPLHLPPAPGPGIIGPTQADYHDLNKGKAATLPRGARWNWTTGCAWGINFPDEGDETEEERAFPPSLRIAPGDEESRRWDTTWWRMRLCQHWRVPKPMFEPGEVYRPGSMKGQWKGRIYVPTAETFHNLLYTPQYPGPADERNLFSEAGVYILMQPFHVDLEEHHRICGCSSASGSSSSTSQLAAKGKSNANAKTPPSLIHMHPCGVIPTPPPLMQPFTVRAPPAPTPAPASAPAAIAVPDLAEEAARAAAAHSAALEETAALHAGVRRRPGDHDTPMTNADWNDPHAGNLVNVARSMEPQPEGGFNEEDEGGEEQDDRDTHPHPQPHFQPQPQPHPQPQSQPQELQTVHLPVDHSMRNAWFPGRMGGVTFMKRRVMESLAEREERMRGSWERGRSGAREDEEKEKEAEEDDEEDGEDDGEDRNSGWRPNVNTERPRRRDEIVFSLSGMIPDVHVDDKCTTLVGAPDARFNRHRMPSSTSTSTPFSEPRSWVYETYDPMRVGAHDVHMHIGPSSSSFPSSSSLSPSTLSIYSGQPPPSSSSTRTPAPNPSCARCVSIDEERRAEKRKEEDCAMRALLDRAMSGISPSASTSASASANTSNAVYDANGDVEMEDLDMSEFGLDLGGHESEEDDEDEGEEDEEEDGGMISVLGDDRPNGEPGFWVDPSLFSSSSSSPERASSSSAGRTSASSLAQAQSTSAAVENPNPNLNLNQNQNRQQHRNKRTYVPSTRREFDRARISTSSPCSGIADIALTGHTPAQHTLWYSGGRGYTFYGRVRRWDGLIGIMRVGAVGRRVGFGLDGDAHHAHAHPNANVNNGGVAGDEMGNLGGLLMDTTFIFGYLVGEGTFVGEWRVAGADPLRPAWSGPIVLSRR